MKLNLKSLDKAARVFAFTFPILFRARKLSEAQGTNSFDTLDQSSHLKSFKKILEESLKEDVVLLPNKSLELVDWGEKLKLRQLS